MEENTLLSEARHARVSHDYVNAKNLYEQLKAEDETNAEACFFSLYYAILTSQKHNGYENYLTFLNEVDMLVALVGCTPNECLPETEKVALLTDMAEATKRLPKFMYNFYQGAEETSDGNYKSIALLYGFGNMIEVSCDGNEAMMKIAVSMWKSAIELQRQWSAVPFDKTAPEEHALKIQKYDPTYVLPAENKIRKLILSLISFLGRK